MLDALAAAGESAGVRAAVSGSAGAGVLHACLDPDTENEAAARFVQDLRRGLDESLASAAGGFAGQRRRTGRARAGHGDGGRVRGGPGRPR